MQQMICILGKIGHLCRIVSFGIHLHNYIMGYFKFILLFFLCFSVFSEEIVFVQAISNEKNRIMISRGAKTGISQGMKSTFSNPNFSIVARAIEINRDSSIWSPIEKETILPFKRGDLISFEKDPFAVWEATSRINTVIAKYKKRSIEDFLKKKNFLLLKSSYGYSMTESSSEIPAENVKGRSSSEFEVYYEHYLNEKFDLLLGFRYQKDVSTTKNPTLESLYARFLFQSEILYKFDEYAPGRFLYLDLGIGVGTSVGKISGVEVQGASMSIPSFRFGHHTKLGKSSAVRFELTGEVVYSREEFPDNSIQSTTMFLTKVGIGFLF